VNDPDGMTAMPTGGLKTLIWLVFMSFVALN